MAQTLTRWYSRTTRSKKFALFDNFIPQMGGSGAGNSAAWDDVAKDIYFGPTPAPPSGGGQGVFGRSVTMGFIA